MKPNQLGGPRFAVVALALAAAMLALVDARGPAAGAPADPTPPPQARRAVEGAVVRANLMARLEARMGDAFAGAWYEPARARLRVGIASPAGGRVADAIAAQAGLGESVVQVPVASTWAELESVQARWDRRLADLLELQQAATGLLASENAVGIELTSSVSDDVRTTLEREAGEESVNVSVTTAARPYFNFGPDARCKKFAEFVADCNPTLVGGVYIDDLKKGWLGCTAGPTVRQVDRSTTVKAQQTFVLTAGHCIDEHGKVGGTWYARDNQPTTETDVIGNAKEYIREETDVGVIEVTTKYWAQAKDPPLVPAIAWWDPTTESTPFPVVGQTNPIQGETTCHSGMRTGTGCGTIKHTNFTVKFPNGIEVKKLARVEMEGGAKVGNGDSGGPWFANDVPNYVMGTHVLSDREPGTEFGVVAFFQPLNVSFEQLDVKRKLKLELLTEENQYRHRKFKAGKYPATVTGTDNSSAEKFTAFGSTIECTERKFEGSLSEASASLELTPTYGGCTSGGAWPVKISHNGCKYRLTWEGEISTSHHNAKVDVACPEGKAGIELFIYSTHADMTASKPMCTLTVLPQTGLETATLTNSGEGIAIDSSSLAGLDVKVKSTSCACPGEAMEAETGSGVFDLDGGMALSASSGGEAVKLEIGE